MDNNSSPITRSGYAAVESKVSLQEEPYSMDGVEEGKNNNMSLKYKALGVIHYDPRLVQVRKPREREGLT